MQGEAISGSHQWDEVCAVCSRDLRACCNIHICISSVGGWAGLGWIVSRFDRPSTLDGLSILVDIDRSCTLSEWTIDVISRM